MQDLAKQSFQNDHSLLCNTRFRELFWEEIATMPIDERKYLFSADVKDSFHVGRILVHLVCSESELQYVIQLMPTWNQHMQMHLQYLERKFKWISRTVIPRLQRFLNGDTS